MRLTELHSTRKTERPPGGGYRPGQPRRWLDRASLRAGWQTIRHTAVRPSVVLPTRPGLLILSTILLIGVAAALVIGDRQQRDLAEFDLLDVPVSPNFNHTDATGLVVPAFDLQQARHQETDAGPIQQVSNLSGPELQSVLPAVENCYSQRARYPGETPMTRTWRLLSYQAMLATALSLSPVVAQTRAADAEKLDEIQKQIKELRQAVSETQKSSSEKLDSIQRDLTSLRTAQNIGLQTAQKNIDDLREELTKLRLDLENLKSKMATTPAPPTNRVALFPPAEQMPDPNSTARVELVNTWNNEVAVVVNGRTYYVPPGQTRLTNPIPAGLFTYEVLGIRPQVTRSVGRGGVFTVHVHPLP